MQKPGVPADLPRIAFPLAPESAMMEYEGWDEIVARTAPLAGRPQRDAEEMAMLIYTSGSTGTPKGAMTSFRAISAAGAGFAAFTRAQTRTAEQGRVLSYLPLAHSFERSCVEAASLVDGNNHVFFAESLDTFLQDLHRAQPTVFISVPRLWLKFQQGVFAKMPPAKLDRLLGIPILGRIVDPRPHRREEGAQGPGPGCRAPGRQWLGAAAAGADPLVPPARAEAVRGLRHDRGQLLLGN